MQVTYYLIILVHLLALDLVQSEGGQLRLHDSHLLHQTPSARVVPGDQCRDGTLLYVLVACDLVDNVLSVSIVVQKHIVQQIVRLVLALENAARRLVSLIMKVLYDVDFVLEQVGHRTENLLLAQIVLLDVQMFQQPLLLFPLLLEECRIRSVLQREKIIDQLVRCLLVCNGNHLINTLGIC